jgi:hypothetical protein
MYKFLFVGLLSFQALSAQAVDTKVCELETEGDLSISMTVGRHAFAYLTAYSILSASINAEGVVIIEKDYVRPRFILGEAIDLSDEVTGVEVAAGDLSVTVNGVDFEVPCGDWIYE